jgi:hypothetical protein
VRRGLAAAVVGLLAVGLIAVWLLCAGQPQSVTKVVDVSSAVPTSTSSNPPPLPRSATHTQAHAKRNALRERIAKALEEKEPALPDAPVGSPAPAKASASRRTSGELANRIGPRHQPLIDYMNEDFMPLAEECIHQAEQRNPRLSGMLGLAIEIIADEELGGVIDRAEPSRENNVVDEELIECVRQTALSVILPAPLVTGREALTITLRVGAQPDAGRSD